MAMSSTVVCDNFTRCAFSENTSVSPMKLQIRMYLTPAFTEGERLTSFLTSLPPVILFKPVSSYSRKKHLKGSFPLWQNKI